MIQEIRSQFDPEAKVADLCILYEVTGYKDECSQDEFWDQYVDFFELGDEKVTAMNAEDLGKLIDELIEEEADSEPTT